MNRLIMFCKLLTFKHRILWFNKFGLTTCDVLKCVWNLVLFYRMV